MSDGNLVTYAKFLGYGMKYETYETDSPMIGHYSESPLTTGLKTLYEPFPIFRVDSNTPFHSTRLLLI